MIIFKCRGYLDQWYYNFSDKFDGLFLFVPIWLWMFVIVYALVRLLKLLFSFLWRLEEVSYMYVFELSFYEIVSLIPCLQPQQKLVFSNIYGDKNAILLSFFLKKEENIRKHIYLIFVCSSPEYFYA